MTRRGPRCPGEDPDVQERTRTFMRGSRCQGGDPSDHGENPHLQEGAKTSRRGLRPPGHDPGVQEGPQTSRKGPGSLVPSGEEVAPHPDVRQVVPGLGRQEATGMGRILSVRMTGVRSFRSMMSLSLVVGL